MKLMDDTAPIIWLCRRTPHGVRGLKSVCEGRKQKSRFVAPRTGCVD